MSSKSEIKDAIRKISKPNHDGFDVVCTVDSVDETAKTCYCISVKDEADIFDVRLIANDNDGFLIFPTEGSKVIVSYLSDGSAYVSMFSEINKIKIDVIDEIEVNCDGDIKINGDIIKLNGITNGGIAKTREVALKFNVLEVQENAFKAIVTAIINAGISSPGTPVTNAILAAYFPAYNVAPIVPTTQAEISNDTVKHG